MTRRTGAAGTAAVALIIAGCAAAAGSRSQSATAVISDAQGATIGTAVLTERADHTVSIALDARRLPPGEHGIHLHAVGSCDRPGYTTAGPHFNPAGRAHGLHNPAGAHNGDLPNLVADANGNASYRATVLHATLSAGPNTLMDADLSAIVIHAAADDQATDPSGNSGARIACGVVLIPPR